MPISGDESDCLNEESVRNIVFHPTLNVFIVVYQNHLRVLDARSGHALYVTPKLIDDGELHVLYSKCADKVLAISKDTIGVRSHHACVLHLNSILQSCVPTEQSPIRLDLTHTDASLLLQCLTAVGRPEHTCLNCSDRDSVELLSQLRSGLEAGSDQTANNNAKWVFVCVRLPWLALHCLLSAVQQAVLGSAVWRHALASVSHALHRVCRLAPAGSMFEHCEPLHSLCGELERRRTFKHWPHSTYKWALPVPMAQAGFYHSPGRNHPDMVMCFACNASLVMWEPTDEPWSEHERHSPACPLVKGEVTANVSSAVSQSTQPAQPWLIPSTVAVAESSAFSAATTADVQLGSVSAISSWDRLLAVASNSARIAVWSVANIPQCVTDFTINSGVLAEMLPHLDLVTREEDVDPQSGDTLSEIKHSDNVSMLALDSLCLIPPATASDPENILVVSAIRLRRICPPGYQDDQAVDQCCHGDSNETSHNILLTHAIKLPCSCEMCDECFGRHGNADTPTPTVQTAKRSPDGSDQVKMPKLIPVDTAGPHQWRPIGAITLPSWCQHLRVSQLLHIPPVDRLLVVLLKDCEERGVEAAGTSWETVQPDLLPRQTAATAVLLLYSLSATEQQPDSINTEWNDECHPLRVQVLPAHSTGAADYRSAHYQPTQQLLMLLSDGQLQLLSADSLKLMTVLLQPGPDRVDFCYCDSLNCVVVCSTDGQLLHVSLSSDLSTEDSHEADIEEFTAMLSDSTPDSALLLRVGQLMDVAESSLSFSAITPPLWQQLSPDVLQRIDLQREFRQNMHVWRLKKDSSCPRRAHVFELTLLRPALVACVELVFTVLPVTGSIDHKVAYLLRIPAGASRNHTASADQVIDPDLVLDGPISLGRSLDASSHSGSVVFRCLDLLQHQQRSLAVVICHKRAKNRCAERGGTSAGAECFQEVGIAILGHKQADTTHTRQQRVAVLKSKRFHQRLVNTVCCQYSVGNVLLCQHLALDNLLSIASVNLSNKSVESSDTTITEVVQQSLRELIFTCFVRGSRHLALRFCQLLSVCLQASEAFAAPLFASLVSFLPRLVEFKSAKGLRYFFVMFTELTRGQVVEQCAVALCVSQLIKIIEAWEKVSDFKLDLLNSRFGLNVSPYGRDTIDLIPWFWQGAVTERSVPDNTATNDSTDGCRLAHKAIGAALAHILPMCRHYSRLTDGQEMCGVVDVEPLHFTCRSTSNLVSFTCSNSQTACVNLESAESTTQCGAWQHLLYPPVQYCGEMSQIHSGFRRYVILDFHKPIILTDVVLPSCDMFSSVALHYWPFVDGAASVRLAFSTVISHQHLQLSNLHPPPICRFLKISLTISGNVTSSNRKFHLGRYYGYTAVMPWQTGVSTHCLRHVAPPKEISTLETVADHAQLRLSQCLERLTEALENEQRADCFSQSTAREHHQPSTLSCTDVPALYHKCHSLRHQYAAICSLLERFRLCTTSATGVTSPQAVGDDDDDGTPTLSTTPALECSSGRYQLLTTHLLQFLLSSSSSSVSKLSSLLTSAVCRRLLLVLCRAGVSEQLQWLGCSVLLRCHVIYGLSSAVAATAAPNITAESSGCAGWWPGFLADVSVRLLAACSDLPSPDADRIFIMATILAQRTVLISRDVERVFLEGVLRRLIDLADVKCQSAAFDQLTSYLVFVSVLINRYLTHTLAARWRFVGGESVLLRSAGCDPAGHAGSVPGATGGRWGRRRIMSQLKHCYRSIGGLNSAGKVATSKAGGVGWRLGTVRLQRESVSSPVQVAADGTPSGASSVSTATGHREPDEWAVCVVERDTAELCCRRLLQIVLDRKRLCTDLLMMVSCKLISWLTVACRPVLHLAEIVSEQQLMSAFTIYTCSEQFNSSHWRSYSVLCLLQDLVSLEVRMCQPSSNAALTESFGHFPAAADEATPADTADSDQPDVSASADDQPSATDIELTSAMLSALPFAAMDAFDEDSSGEADASSRHAETETDTACRAEELSVNEETRDDHFENELDVLDAVAICESLLQKQPEIDEALKKVYDDWSVEQKFDEGGEHETTPAVSTVTISVNSGLSVTSLLTSPVLSHVSAVVTRLYQRQHRTAMLNVCTLLSDNGTLDSSTSTSASASCDHRSTASSSINHTAFCQSSSSLLIKCFLRHAECTANNSNNMNTLQRLMELWLTLESGTLLTMVQSAADCVGADVRFCRQLLRLLMRARCVPARTWATLFDVLINSGERRHTDPSLSSMLIGETVLEQALYKFLTSPRPLADPSGMYYAIAKYGEAVCQRFDSLLKLVTRLGSAGCWLLVRVLARCFSSAQLSQLPADALLVLLTRLMTAECACVCVPFGADGRQLLVRLLHDTVISLCRHLDSGSPSQDDLYQSPTSETARDDTLAVITAVFNLILSFCHADTQQCGGQTDEIKMNQCIEMRWAADTGAQSLTDCIWSDYELVRDLLESFALLRNGTDLTETASFHQMCVDRDSASGHVSAAMCRLFRLMLQPACDHSQLLSAFISYISSGSDMCLVPISSELHCFLVQMIEEKPEFAQCLRSEDATERLFSALLDNCRISCASRSEPSRAQRYDMLLSDGSPLSVPGSGSIPTISSSSATTVTGSYRERLTPIEDSDCIDISQYCEATCCQSPASVLLRPGRHQRRYHTASWTYQFDDVTSTCTSTSVPIHITLPFAAQLRQVHIVPQRDYSALCPSALSLELGPGANPSSSTSTTTTGTSSGYSPAPVTLSIHGCDAKYLCVPVPEDVPPLTHVTLRVYRPRRGDTVGLNAIRVLVSTARCQIVTNREPSGVYSCHHSAQYMRRWLAVLESLSCTQPVCANFISALSRQLCHYSCWPSLLQLSNTAATRLCLTLTSSASSSSSSSSSDVCYHLLNQLIIYCNSCGQPYQLQLLYQLFVQLVARGDARATVGAVLNWLDRTLSESAQHQLTDLSLVLSASLIHCLSACLWYSASTFSVNDINNDSSIFFNRVRHVYECCLRVSRDVKLFTSLRWFLCSLCHLCPSSFTELVNHITVDSYQHGRGANLGELCLCDDAKSSVQWSSDQLSILLTLLTSPGVARLAVEGHLLLILLKQAVDCCYYVMDQHCGRYCDSAVSATAAAAAENPTGDESGVGEDRTSMWSSLHTTSDTSQLYDRAGSIVSMLASASTECSICSWLSQPAVASLWLGLLSRLVAQSATRCRHSPPDHLLTAVCHLAATSCHHQQNQQLLASCLCKLLASWSDLHLPVFLRQLLLSVTLREHCVSLQLDTSACDDSVIPPPASVVAVGSFSSWRQQHPRFWDTHVLSLPHSATARSAISQLFKRSEGARRAAMSGKQSRLGAMRNRALLDWCRTPVQASGPIGRAQKRALANLRRQTNRIQQNDANKHPDNCVPVWDQMAEQYCLVDTELSASPVPHQATISRWLQFRQQQADTQSCQHGFTLTLRRKEDADERCVEMADTQLPCALSALSDAGGVPLLAPSLQRLLARQMGGCILNPSLSAASASRHSAAVAATPAEEADGDDTWVKLGTVEETSDTMMEDIIASEDRGASGVSTATAESADKTVIFPPHCLPCFSLFLGLPGYGELLMTDHTTARILLRLALGDWDSANVTEHICGELPVKPFRLMRQLLDQHPADSDDGQLLRQTCFCSGLLHLLLSCISALSHYTSSLLQLHTSHSVILASLQSQWVCQLFGVPSPPTSSSSVLPGTTLNEAEADEQYWAKGTGFGTGSTAQKWSADHALLQQRVEEEHLAQLLLLLASFLSSDDSLSSSPIADSPTVYFASGTDTVSLTDQLPSLLSSAQIPTMLHALLRNDSVLDLAQHVPLYRAALRLMRAFVSYRQMASVLHSFVPLLSNVKSLVDTYSHHLSGSRPASSCCSVGDAEMLALTSDLDTTCCLLAAVCSGDVTTTTSDVITSDSSCESPAVGSAVREDDLQLRYMNDMRPLQFGTYEMIVEQSGGGIRLAESHHYESLVRSTANHRSLPARMKRLAQEAVTLSTSLPLSLSSSVFIRVDLSRLDVMKVLITGSADTPYSNGCFVFDVFFPSDYPQRPVLINLETTGRGTVRFNPNFYVDGKVCLSVLNTWHGRPEEKWNSQTSSLLQVLVSIQSLIIVAEPFFNEPGYERSRNTAAGMQSSREYDANIRQASVRWAMLQHLKSPSSCFAEVIRRHFYLKRDVILKEVEDWIVEQEGMEGVAATDPIKVSTTQLKSHFAALKEELAQLKSPDEETRS